MRFELGLLEGEHATGINVGISRQFLTQQQIPFSSFARLTVEDTQCVVQLVPQEREGDDSRKALLSPIVAFRLASGLLLERLLPTPLTLEADLEALTVDPGQLRANWVRFESLEPPPNDSVTPPSGFPSREGEKALAKYLQGGTQFVAEGDVITVDVKLKYPASDPFYGRRYYRVSAMEPKDLDHAWSVHQTETHLHFQVASEGLLPPVRVEDEEDRLRGPLLPHWETIAKIFAPLLLKRHDVSFRLGLLLHGGIGKRVAVREAARALGMKCMDFNAVDLCGDNFAETIQEIKKQEAIARSYAPCFFLIRDIHKLTSLLRVENEMNGQPGSKLTTALKDLTQQSNPEPEKYPPLSSSLLRIRQVFTDERQIPPMEEPHKTQILNFFMEKYEMERVVENPVAVRNLILEAFQRPTPHAFDSLCYKIHAAPRDGYLRVQDVEELLREFQLRTGAEKTAEIPKVEWSDIGGLEEVKALIRETVELPIKHRPLFATGLNKRRGVVLHGPPGVGKTMLAKAIATECKTKFISIKGPELLDAYVGETERKVRKLFDDAKQASPCILFFDELDSLAPSKGAKESGEVMDRIVSQFRAELDQVSAGQHEVFVFGATNRVDLIDPALLRPGRFDKLVEVKPPETLEAKLRILEAKTEKFVLDGEIDLLEVAQRLTRDVSGAELEAVCSLAWMNGVNRHIALHKSDTGTVKIRQEDFMAAVEERGY